MSGRIVVGVDGSERADAAVHWALEEARLRDCSVDVVHAWNIPYVGDVPGLTVADLAAGTQKAADELLRHVVERTIGDDPGVKVTNWTAQGSAARVLIDAAKGADMLVVASRGRGGFTGLLLGSVSQACVHHAPCPIVVIPSRT